MLKYFKRQKGRRTAHDVVANNNNSKEKTEEFYENTNEVDAIKANKKRNSLRSTTSFCDEVFFEEFLQDETTTTTTDEDAGTSVSTLSGACIIGAADEDIFKYHSRLSMTLPSIVNDPNCLSYFVQFLEHLDALPLIKFYLDIENFRISAITQWEKDRLKQTSNAIVNHPTTNINSAHDNDNNDDDNVDDVDDDDDAIDDADVPELKTLFDLSMRKPLTDDEKSQIYAEQMTKVAATTTTTTQQPTIVTRRHSTHPFKLKAKTKSELSLCETVTTESDQCRFHSKMSAASVKDAIAIYQKYLIINAMNFVCLPVNILTQISLLLCKRDYDENEDNDDDHHHDGDGDGDGNLQADEVNSIKTLSSSSQSQSQSSSPQQSNVSALSISYNNNRISPHCFDEAQQFVMEHLEREYLNDFLQSTYYCKYCIELIENTTTTTTTTSTTTTTVGHSAYSNAGDNNSNHSFTIKRDDDQLNIYDILYSEVTLFFFMEFLEQHGERDCLDFWTAAINFRKSFTADYDSIRRDMLSTNIYHETTTTTTPLSSIERERIEKENDADAQADAMIIYEKFFSLQSECRLWMSEKLRCRVEQSICAVGHVAYCFDLPLQVIAKYLERKYFAAFLKSQLFGNYLNELKTKLHVDEMEEMIAAREQTDDTRIIQQVAEATAPLQHQLSFKRTNKTNTTTSTTSTIVAKSKLNQSHRKTLSDCTNDTTSREYFKHISQHNTLLAMDSSGRNQHKKQTHTLQHTTAGTNLSIDSRQFTNPQLLWQRSLSSTDNSGGASGGGLQFGRVNSFGRYERDFETIEAFNQLNNKQSNWSLAMSGNKIKNAMRKLVNLPEEKMQEEIAWQVAEMIVKDVTSITMNGTAMAGVTQQQQQQP